MPAEGSFEPLGFQVEPPMNVRPIYVQFNRVALWIRVINLPIRSMTKEVGTEIRQSVGYLIGVDALSCGIAWGEFLRIRVNLDIF